MRRKPPGKLLPSAHAVDREYKVITALYPTGFPVAQALRPVHGRRRDRHHVLRHGHGRGPDPVGPVPARPMRPPSATPIYMAAVKTLADLHNTDYKAVGLDDFGRPGNYMPRQIDRWTKQYKASETQHHRDHRAADRVAARRPCRTTTRPPSSTPTTGSTTWSCTPPSRAWSPCSTGSWPPWATPWPTSPIC